MIDDPLDTVALAELRVLTDEEILTVATLEEEVRRGLVPAHAVALFVHHIESDAVGEA